MNLVVMAEEEERLKERRKAPRFRAHGDVTLTLECGTNCKGSLKDVSRIGAFVALDKVNDEWAYQTARLDMISQVDGEELEIEGRCAVVRVTPKGVGIHIFDIDVPSRKSFVKFTGFVQQPENAI